MAATRRVEDEGLLEKAHADALVLNIAFDCTYGRVERMEWLTLVGERRLAARVRAREKDLVVWMISRINALIEKHEVAHPTWKAECRPWNGTSDGEVEDAPRAASSNLCEEVYQADLAACVEEWRRAVRGEDGWTVAVALSFKYFVALEDLRGEGALELTAVQRARAEGVLDVNLSWLALDTIAAALVAPGPRTDEADFDRWMRSEEGKARRAALFKRRVLESVGEVELAQVMSAEPEEFRRRVEMAEREWVL